MKDFTEIYEWIDKGEDEKLDFKRSITNAHKIAKTMVSFANSKGGKIVVGVDDFGEIMGIDVEEELYMLNRAALMCCEPSINFKQELYEQEEVVVLVIIVGESEQKPHAAVNEEGESKVYVRVDDESLLAGTQTIKRLKNEDTTTHDIPILSSKQVGLINYLEENGTITIKEFKHLMNISERRAKRSIIELVQQGVLNQHDHNKEDYFSLNKSPI